MVKVSTSVLSLKDEDYVHSFYNLETAKTDYFHIDVMDGEFVKNNTVERMKQYSMALSHITTLGLDVHLMVKNVENYIDEFIEFEPSIISFHIEAISEKARVLDIIDDLKRNNIKVRIGDKPRYRFRKNKRIPSFNSCCSCDERISR